jgi:hypothetical protein
MLNIQNSFIENIRDHIEIPEITNSEEESPPEIILEIKKKYKDKCDLDKYKNNDLRNALKYYKSTINFQKNSQVSHRKYTTIDQKKIKNNFDFGLSGKKQDLIDRIADFLNKENSVRRIQKTFRGRLVRNSFELRGPSLKNRSLCVNDTDFYTFDKLKDIEISDFFSYKCGEFIYGFRLSSIITLFKNRVKKTLNPYTRTNMDYLLASVEKLSRLSKIIHKDVSGDVAEFVNDKITVRSTPSRIIYNRSELRNVQNENLYTETANKLNQLRQQPVPSRIVQLFMEMDQLGNYTESTWFSNLDRNQNIRLYRVLYEIWSYRAQIPNETKNKICPLGNPFTNTMAHALNINQFDESNIQTACLCAMENMVYTGINAEFKTLGTFQVLCALTVVSPLARQAMPWLYDSVV